jgi:hypothetical protein
MDEGAIQASERPRQNERGRNEAAGTEQTLQGEKSTEAEPGRLKGEPEAFAERLHHMCPLRRMQRRLGVALRKQVPGPGRILPARAPLGSGKSRVEVPGENVARMPRVEKASTGLRCALLGESRRPCEHSHARAREHPKRGMKKECRREEGRQP